MMRAASDIYEHPQLTSSEVWSKGDSRAAAEALSPAGVISALALSLAAAASTYAVLRYSSLGGLLRDSVLVQKLGL
ncbi:hypothetical protein BDZ89DRAFT_1073472 [Hymenopellis radicata]|nr:hypothetical protein BDZ89DRAFT_1073472 [Hymenopellis radicata]